MSGLFLRVYLGVLAAAVFGLVLAWGLARLPYDRDLREMDRAYIELIHPLIVADLAKAPEEDWPATLEWWRRVSEYDLRILASDDPFWAELGRVEPHPWDLSVEVHTGVRTDYIWASYAIPDTELVLYYFYKDPSSIAYMVAMALGYVVIFSALAFGTYLLLRPIIVSTQELTSTAQAYAEGRLDARVKAKGTGPLALLSRQFNRMALEIQHKMHEQEVMTTAISHELKTPLTRLRLALDMAIASRDDTQLRDMLGEMDHDLDDLDELTAELLTLAKLTYRGQALEVHSVSLQEILGRLIPKLSALEPNVKLSFGGALGAKCCGHDELLSRAFSNLLINGQRYAESAVQVTLMEERGAVVVWVDDDGPGIPPDRRQEVFMPFSRLDRSRNRDTGGFGLGLAIVKQSLEVQGGTIYVTESSIGGARFVVRLPAA